MATKKAKKKSAPAKKAPAKKAPAKKAPAKKAPAKKAGPFDRWLAYIASAPNKPVAKKMNRRDPTLAAVVALAEKHDARVASLIELLVDRHTSFYVFDFEAYPEMFVRGKGGDRWNEGEKVVTADDVVLARNGAGDIHVWNTKTGGVRFLVHDEDWRIQRSAKNLDDWIHEEMYKVAEFAGLDQLEEADAEYVDRLRFAAAMVGEDALDEEVREFLAGAKAE